MFASLLRVLPCGGRSRVDRFVMIGALSLLVSPVSGQEPASQRGVPQEASARVDRALPSYTRAAAVAGTIRAVGSDTMNGLMTLWGEEFVKLYPEIKVAVEGKGSSTAPPALTQGTANFAPMSRSMTKAEVGAFRKKFGYGPTPIATGVDMIAIYVHRDNPIRDLTLSQLAAIFGAPAPSGNAAPEPARRADGRVVIRDTSGDREPGTRTWGQLGLTGAWADQTIRLHGRNASSGTYAHFREHALGGGRFRSIVKQQPTSNAVLRAVAADRYAIGYSGIGLLSDAVRAVPLARSEADRKRGEIFAPEAENAYSGDYPLSRFLLLYVNYDRDGELDPLRREFLSYVLSRQGQLDVVAAGYLPLTFRAAASQRAKFK